MSIQRPRGIQVYLNTPEEKEKIAKVKGDLTFSQWGRRAFKRQLAEDLLRIQHEKGLESMLRQARKDDSNDKGKVEE